VQRLARSAGKCGEEVIVNLRPDTDPETAFVRFDRPRVLRVLARIAADLNELAGRPTKPVADDPVDARLPLEFGTVAG
jgi:hypothetical protein